MKSIVVHGFSGQSTNHLHVNLSFESFTWKIRVIHKDQSVVGGAASCRVAGVGGGGVAMIWARLSSSLPRPSGGR
jgi:hypothetical protein